MPRQARLEIPGVPLHITQRGVNRCAIFLHDDDRRHYLRLLGESAASHDMQIHAYVLMGNHVHLLVSCGAARKVSLAMRQLGQAYVTGFNRRHRRRRTPWEVRFKSCLVDSDRYLLTAYRYIELNPVRAAMTEKPQDHHWSNVHANLALCEDSLVTPHACFLALRDTRQSHAETYLAWLEQGVSDDELMAIRKHLQQERAFGTKRFQAIAEKALGRPVSVRRPGRPSRDENDGGGT
ncbi:transposase [Rhodanobacter sp. AS-Z3]|uniref:transposase n=1 Tax=Rhodanobacter sp. AS-Z3 TaxID=3031330 RepID=UPI0024787170|nr:transposase [Rhodanobacter sp. AS-Z3]WEN14289.1 transposase [Rhodanobacter sp. AS-Z3]